MSQITSTPPHSGTYFQKGLGLKAFAQEQLARDYHSRVVDYLRRHQYVLRAGNLQFHLAREFGFCYGVERAVEYAYQAREKFPDRRIFLTGEIIHNPHVNRRMLEMEINFLSGQYSRSNDYRMLRPEDVVILPAFGVTREQFRQLSAIGCILVDTTCGSVLNVWKRVEQYARDGFTAVIHGKYAHEETRATSSQALKYPNGRYLVVRDMAETEEVCAFLAGRLSRAEFLTRFRPAVSPGFDPDHDLVKIGVANQTTMLSSESLAIAERLKSAMIEKYGAAEIDRHFRNFDTICSATQDRQDAVLELVQNHGLDLMLVIGGYNSSNTNHLVEIAGQHTHAYHIDDAACLVDARTLRHKPAGQPDEITTSNWLPTGELKIGITAGASTPNNKIGETIVRLAQLRGFNLEDWMLD
ncbi:MAG: 4-hydroxy-3-methylbut-2-enyl diphosphate reductase [candidate division KSB1 bacterium]|nr:4-hydroxy-3-methylbut-2-enyl diphosphate reductase [candidate division KSB1 bacterium]MDZ7272749.1 4-hydroxy-3-methylbut-2-enyl diphosphate reductase [candidate division KSB1 bacterium]MDZ7284226.1 4-hydroxy-3-methylbut-2-enyl diphosphate reductase [candidate division KSB1 bacterium]MDZ7297375.1 4-hydroxy-3-methylbut-2-enyl diphosphate reductase [candidate division KSB1 bacterium]MDZ7309051.1 4-hydroxy-3-methylbut-2-enyl diphosphate reductase [candidate division KSB1 bacterium]